MKIPVSKKISTLKDIQELLTIYDKLYNIDYGYEGSFNKILDEISNRKFKRNLKVTNKYLADIIYDLRNNK